MAKELKCYIVAERKEPVHFLRCVLPVELVSKIKFVGKSPFSDEPMTDLTSAATTLLVKEHKPVVLLMDTHSIDEKTIRERRAILEELMRMGSGGVPHKVILFEPTFEVLFFKAPGLIEKVFHQPHKISDELALLGESNPQAALSLLYKRNGSPANLDELLNKLEQSSDIENLRSTSPVNELIEFLNQLPDSEATRSRQLVNR